MQKRIIIKSKDEDGKTTRIPDERQENGRDQLVLEKKHSEVKVSVQIVFV